MNGSCQISNPFQELECMYMYITDVCAFEISRSDSIRVMFFFGLPKYRVDIMMTLIVLSHSKNSG